MNQYTQNWQMGRWGSGYTGNEELSAEVGQRSYAYSALDRVRGRPLRNTDIRHYLRCSGTAGQDLLKLDVPRNTVSQRCNVTERTLYTRGGSILKSLRESTIASRVLAVQRESSKEKDHAEEKLN